jgi:hypothetical protein
MGEILSCWSVVVSRGQHKLRSWMEPSLANRLLTERLHVGQGVTEETLDAARMTSRPSLAWSVLACRDLINAFLEFVCARLRANSFMSQGLLRLRFWRVVVDEMIRLPLGGHFQGYV